MSRIIQLEIENSEDFKNEIIRGVVEQIKNLTFSNQRKENPEDLLSREQTANLLNISLVTLWGITRDKTLPSYKIGRRVLYKRGEVLNSLIERGKSVI